MTTPDDFTEKARDLMEHPLFRPFRTDAATEVLATALHQAVMAERKRCADLIRNGYERNVTTVFRGDGQSSKHDKCGHGQTMYEDCEACLLAAILSEERGT